MANELKVIEDLVYSIEPSFNNVLSDATMSFKREAEFAIQQISKSDYSLSMAVRNQQAVRDAVTNVAAVGLSLNPVRKQAYLVPMDNRIQLMISYMGLLDLAIDSGSVLWGQAKIVYGHDVFRLNGYDKPPTHEFAPFDKNRGDMIGVYVVVKTPGGDYLTDHMTIDDAFDIRDRTNSWKAWISKKKKCPWVTDEAEMIKKTVIKRASKTWPKTARLDKAVGYLNTDGGEGIDMSEDSRPQTPVAQSAAPFNLGSWIDRISGASDLDEIRQLRREALTAASKYRDKIAYDRIVNAIERRRADLKQPEKEQATDIQYREVNT